MPERSDRRPIPRFQARSNSDLVCQTPNLRVPWNMAADIEPLRVLQQKAKLFEEAERHRWLLVLSHEVDQPAGYLEEGGRWRPEPRLL